MYHFSDRIFGGNLNAFKYQRFPETSEPTKAGRRLFWHVSTVLQRQENTSCCNSDSTSGEALKTIENLGHSAFAYEAVKDRLERKYGGKRRQIALYLDELEQFRQVRLGNARDLEQFADLLDIAIINLKEAGRQYELGDGSLYTKLQRKLPESMLARYHRWIFENSLSESVLTLRTWVIQESEFQTVASETVHGVTGMMMDTQLIQAVLR